MFKKYHLIFCVSVKSGRIRNAMGTQVVGECFQSLFEFSQTWMSVSITQYKHTEIFSISPTK